MRTVLTPSHIGAILGARRKTLKLSQEHVATKVGLSQNRLSVLEANPATLTTKQLLALLNVLGLEMTISESAASKLKSEW